MNGCEFCTSEKIDDSISELASKRLNINDEWDIVVQTLMYRLEKDNTILESCFVDGINTISATTKINFCPMCGRKLNLDYKPYR